MSRYARREFITRSATVSVALGVGLWPTKTWAQQDEDSNLRPCRGQLAYLVRPANRDKPAVLHGQCLRMGETVIDRANPPVEYNQIGAGRMGVGILILLCRCLRGP